MTSQYSTQRLPSRWFANNEQNDDNDNNDDDQVSSGDYSAFKQAWLRSDPNDLSGIGPVNDNMIRADWNQYRRYSTRAFANNEEDEEEEQQQEEQYGRLAQPVLFNRRQPTLSTSRMLANQQDDEEDEATKKRNALLQKGSEYYQQYSSNKNNKKGERWSQAREQWKRDNAAAIIRTYINSGMYENAQRNMLAKQLLADQKSAFPAFMLQHPEYASLDDAAKWTLFDTEYRKQLSAKITAAFSHINPKAMLPFESQEFVDNLVQTELNKKNAGLPSVLDLTFETHVRKPKVKPVSNKPARPYDAYLASWKAQRGLSGQHLTETQRKEVSADWKNYKLQAHIVPKPRAKKMSTEQKTAVNLQNVMAKYQNDPLALQAIQEAQSVIQSQSKPKTKTQSKKTTSSSSSTSSTRTTKKKKSGATTDAKASAYSMFIKAHSKLAQERYLNTHPTVDKRTVFGQVSKQLAAQWNLMTQDQKQPYERAAAVHTVIRKPKATKPTVSSGKGKGKGNNSSTSIMESGDSLLSMISGTAPIAPVYNPVVSLYGNSMNNSSFNPYMNAM